MEKRTGFTHEIVYIHWQKIRPRRRELGMLQIELAKKASLSESYLSSIERGQRPYVSINTAYQLSKALHLPYEELVFSTQQSIDTIMHELMSLTHALLDMFTKFQLLQSTLLQELKKLSQQKEENSGT